MGSILHGNSDGNEKNRKDSIGGDLSIPVIHLRLFVVSFCMEVARRSTKGKGEEDLQRARES